MLISKSTDLIGYSKLFQEFTFLINEELLPSKLLISGRKGIGKKTFIFHFLNYIFSKDENNKYEFDEKKINFNNKSYKLILSNTHPNLIKIQLKKDKKFIDIDQIRRINDFVNKSSLNNKKKIILIEDVEHLNINAVNAILKILEDSNNKNIFFLVYNSEKKISETLKSRCIEYKLSLDPEYIPQIIYNHYGKDYLIKISDEFKHYSFTPGFYISLIDFCNEYKINYEKIKIDELLKKISNEKIYKTSSFVKEHIKLILQIFFIKNLNDDFFLYHHLYKNILTKLNNIIKYNLDMESLFIELNNRILNER